jgi:methylenetetrahydrofolate dehydrogenase (NADP+)/methenyltetrahydrofolate cyclohydrolase
MLLLKWKEKSELLKWEYKELKTQYFWNDKKFVAVLFFGESNPSQIYVKLKKKYSEEIWFECLIFGQWEVWFEEKYPDLVNLQKKEYSDKDEVIELVELLNNDERCVWIICQLPLTKDLKLYQKEICNTISPLKDMDWLWDKLQEWAFNWKIEFLPATPQAVISLWNAYNLWDFEWKIISVIWQSNIVWLPISRYLELKWAEVYAFDIRNTPKEIITQTKKSDVIISCTWALHLVDDRFINEEKNQILIDVGYWFLDGKSTGDVDFEKVKNKVYAISPVPWWVGPMTVASLFGNIFSIQKQKDIIKSLMNNRN